MRSPYLLHITNLTISYGNETSPALVNFSLQSNDTGIILIAGNSGSGKSTLAKSFLKLLPENCNISGSIEIDEVNILSLDRNQLLRKIGFLPQFPMDYNLNLLVYDEIAFPLENLGYSKREIASSIDSILNKLHIAHLKYKLITELSSGELQKVGLATALISRPSILILDEPFARMDSNSELILIELLKDLKKDSLIIILEHHLDYILEICDTVFLLDKGNTISQGTPQKIISGLNTNKPEISKIIIPPDKQNFISYSNLMVELTNYLSNKSIQDQ